MSLRRFIARYTPERLKITLHAIEAWAAACWYGFPSNKLTVIGITGTKGKTTTANLVWSVLHHGGFKTGLIGTANIRIDNEERVNTLHMTMPGPWITQKLLKEMATKGCTHVVMEVTSEGLKYYRHVGITFKVAVFTNLSPEHLSSHNNDFELYKKTKGKLFETLRSVPESISIINLDTPHGEFYAAFPAAKRITYGMTDGMVHPTNIQEHDNGVSFVLDEKKYELHILGGFNVANALPALIIGREFGMSDEKIREGLATLALVPGRMERIDMGQPYTVIVDYAHEQLSMNTLLDTARAWRTGDGRIITIVGAEGGGRDPAKREHIGRAAGTKSDYVIVTTTDPYDDDPVMLAEAVAHFAEIAGKKRGETLFVIIDRREALTEACTMAREGDIILATGMGAQETMIVEGDKALPWNERAIIRDIISNTLR